MNNLLKTYVLLAIIITTTIFATNTKASHYMGGEITWECIPAGQPNAGKFIFQMKVYRECYGSPFGNTQTLASTSPAGSILLYEISGWPKDISPICNNDSVFSHITCATATSSNQGAVEEHIYRSLPVTLNGVPLAIGWTFSWGACCRNPSVNLSTNGSWWLRAKMFPYNNLNTYPCFDNSPTFAEAASFVIDAGYSFQYNQSVYDKELDSLHFEWGILSVHKIG